MSELITLKIHKNRKFSTIFLECVENKDLSWGAKGLHTYLISRPPGWKIRYEELLGRSLNGRTSLKNLISQLKSSGYLIIETKRDENGKFTGTIWTIFEVPEPQVRFPSCGQQERPKTRKKDNMQGINYHEEYSSPQKTTTASRHDVVVDNINETAEYNPERITSLLEAFDLKQAVTAAQVIIHSNPKLPSNNVWHAAWCLAWQVKKNSYKISTSWEDVMEGILHKGIRHPIGCPTPSEVIEKRRKREEKRQALTSRTEGER